MTYYTRLGQIPPKRHIQFRKPDVSLYLVGLRNHKFSKNILIQLLFAFVIFINITNAQTRQVIRKEKDVNEEGFDFTCVLGDKGILEYGEVTEGKETFWQYTLLDTMLNEQFVSKVNVMSKGYSNDLIYVPNNNSAFYQVLKRGNGNCLLIKYNPENYKTTTLNFILPKKIITQKIVIFKEYAYIIGDLKKTVSIFKINLSSGVVQKFVLAAPKAKLQSIVQDEANDKFYISYTIKSKKSQDLFVQQYNANGDASGSPISIKLSEDRIPVDIVGAQVDNNTIIFNGSYKTSSRKKALCTGVFIMKVSNSKVDFFKEYTFAEFKNFNDYRSEKAQQRLEKKTQKKLEEGDTDFVKSMVFCHIPYKDKNGYFFVGELYFPTYRTETQTSFVNGRPVTRTVTVFDGYQYTHGILLKTDTLGNKLFDQCIPMYKSYKPFVPTQYLTVSHFPTSIDIYYSDLQNIYYHKVEGENVIEKKSDVIDTQNDNDKVKRTSSDMLYWYKNYFILFGTQKIKNKEDSDKKKRKVIFWNKIAFDI